MSRTTSKAVYAMQHLWTRVNYPTSLTQEKFMQELSGILDGISRWAILPFGPHLVYRMLNPPESNAIGTGDDIDYSKVALPFAMTISAYFLGKFAGSSLSKKFSLRRGSRQFPIQIARLSGMAVSLHFFMFAGWLESLVLFVLLRFLSATLLGFLGATTTKAVKATYVREMTAAIDDGLEMGLDLPRLAAEKAKKHRQSFVDNGKVNRMAYLSSIALSTGLGGILLKTTAKESTNQGGFQSFFFSIGFLLIVSMTVEAGLRRVLDWLPLDHSLEAELPLSPSERKRRLTKNMSPVRSPRQRSDTVESEQFLPCQEGTNSFASHATTGTDRLTVSDSMEFFDCASDISDAEDEIPVSSSQDGEVCLYHEKRCVYRDGSAAFVPPGDNPEIVPGNYNSVCGRNRNKAARMWKWSQQWRYEENVWKIHTMSSPWFRDIKAAYPHVIHGHSKDGYPIVYEQPGKMSLKELFQCGCKVSDVVRHHAFFMEYLSNQVCQTDEVRAHEPLFPQNSSSWGVQIVSDVRGFATSLLSRDVISYFQERDEINNSHYPLNLKRVFVVNSPFWLAGAWTSMKSILPDSAQVEILSSQQYLRALLEHIDEDQIPPEYGGTSPFKLGEHPYEKKLWELVESTEEQGGDKADEFFDSDQRDDTMGGTTPKNSSAVPGLYPSPLVTATTEKTRRRRGNEDEIDNVASSLSIDDYDDTKGHHTDSQAGLFVSVSTVFGVFMLTQGAIETAIPLWMLMPPELGGQGYSSAGSAMVLFFPILFLICLMRTKFSEAVSAIPTKAPMRAFRLGAATQSVALLLLATIPKLVDSEKPQNVGVLLCVMALVVVTILSSLTGARSSTILHRIAAEGLAKNGVNGIIGRIAPRCGIRDLANESEDGRLTQKIGLIGQISGAILVAAIFRGSLAETRASPVLDATCSLLLLSLLFLVLYVLSFSLYLDSMGEFIPHPRDGGHGKRKWSRLFREILSVSRSDLSTLFEEVKGQASSHLYESPGQDPKMQTKDMSMIV